MSSSAWIDSYLAPVLAEHQLTEQLQNLGSLSADGFCSLTIAELGRLGITSVEARKGLHQAALQMKAAGGARRGTSQKAPAGAGALELQHDTELIDLDDGGHLDLLAHAVGPAFQLSPMGGDRPAGKSSSHQVLGAPAQASAPAAPPPAAANALAPEPNNIEEPPKIRVVVRKRPMNRKERERGDEDIVECHMDKSCIVVNETKLKVDLTKYVERHQFNFDCALDENVSNDEVYTTTVQPLVATLFRNGRASCFAYGQTGSGKTFTMSPLPIRAAADIMRYLAQEQWLDVSLHVSCFEIYGNKVYDLLAARKRLNILEDGKKQVCVVGLREVVVTHVDQVKQLIEESNRNRSVGSTTANSDSSRSHSVMQFSLKKPAPPPPPGWGARMVAEAAGGDADGKLIGKISFIDLAGSERGADTYDNDRQTRLEGAEINKSLLALKECIRALDCDARHVPFRGSKLTAVLRDSFLGGQARTVMIANISPNSTSAEHTLNTLRYADRVKELRKERAERAPGGVTPGEDPAYYASVARAAAAVPGQPAASRDKSPAGGRDGGAAASRGAAAAAAAGGGGGPRPRTPSRPADTAGSGHPSRATSGRYTDEDTSAPAGVPAGQRGGSIAAVRGTSAAYGSGGGGAVPGRYREDEGEVEDEEGERLLRQRDDLMDTILEEEEQLITAHRMQIEETMDAVRKEMQLLTEVDQPGSAIDVYVARLEGMLQIKLDLIHGLKAKLERFKEHLNLEEIMSRSIPPSTVKKAPRC